MDSEVTHTLLDDETVIEAELIERDGIVFGVSFPVAVPTGEADE